MALPQTLRNRSNFSGSFTDNLFTNDPTLCAYNDNLLVDNNQKLILRPGSTYLYSGTLKPLTLATRISRLWHFQDESALFGVNGSALFYDDSASFTAITGAHAALPLATADTKVSFSEWKSHIFLTDNAGSPVVKVYYDGAWRVRTAGLPAPVPAYSPSLATQTATAVTYVNAIKAKMVLHFADVTDHVGFGSGTHRVADGVSGSGIGLDAVVLADVYRLTGELLRAYQLHFNDARSTGLYHYRDIPATEWLAGGAIGTVASAEFLAPVATALQSTLVTTAAPTTLPEAIAALNDLKTKFNVHEGVLDSHAGNIGYDIITTAHMVTQTYGPFIPLDYAKIYAVANLYKTKLNTHMAAAASAAYAHTTADTVNPVTATNASTPETLEVLIQDLRQRYTEHDDTASNIIMYHRADEGAGYNLSPRYTNSADYSADTGYPDLYGGCRAGDWDAAIAALNDIKTQFNFHAGHTIAHHPASATVPNPYLIQGDNLVLADYIYAFVHHYSYTIGTDTFEDFSTPLTVIANNVLSTAVQGLAISNIPSLANVATTNYDTSAITIRIYRSTDGGTTLYQVGEIANGVTTFTDVMTDDELITRAALYTTGGVLGNDPPPTARYLHIVNNKAYYGYIVDSGETLKNRVRESITNDPDSCPAGSFDDFEDEVTGISSSRSVPIVFCKNSFYRLEGGFDELGRGALTHTAISDTVGLVSENSLVKTDMGVFFAGTDGFYFTDGYTYRKLSGDWNATYARLISTATKASRITGTYDPVGRRIWWAAQRQTASTDNDAVFILDLNYPFEPHPTWTTASNPTHFNPSALVFYSGLLYRGESAGFLLKHTTSFKTDFYLNGTISTGTAPIRYDFQSCFEDFGAPDVRKWFVWLTWEMERETNVHLQPQARNNDYDAWQDLTKFDYQSAWSWGDPLLIWGSPSYLWNSARGIPGQKRRFPADQVRALYKQVRFTNDYVSLIDSTFSGAATVASGPKTVTLDDVTKSWIADCAGYKISFSVDSYVTEYEINRRNSATVLTLATTPASGSYSWKIKGYQKGEQLRILNYSVLGSLQSRSQQAARAPTGNDV